MRPKTKAIDRITVRLEKRAEISKKRSRKRRLKSQQKYSKTKEAKIVRRKYEESQDRISKRLQRNRSAKTKASKLEWQRLDQKNNAGKWAARSLKRILSKIKRTPKWLSDSQFKEIEQFYILANELQWLCNEKLEVDHIVPLNGKEVCGLHVPWNLQILPKSVNRSKRNKLENYG